MAASKTKKTGNGNKVIKPVNSIHVVVFACSHCGEEIEELKLCNECNSPMKVVQVFEKFGQEADEYLAELKKEGMWDADSVSPKKKKEKIDDGGISGDDLDHLDIPIMGVNDGGVKEDLDDGLSDIFPDEDDEVESATSGSQDLDFMEALEKLDEEDQIEDLEELGPDGLPEL